MRRSLPGVLADRVRVDRYERGIRAHIRPGDVVVEFGTGTGILAPFAARTARQVYALDHSAVIEGVRRVAREPGVTNIEFLRTNSRQFTPPEKVDVILHEQIGDELFDENMVQNVGDLRDRILKPGGRKLHGIDFGCVRSLQQGTSGLPRRWDSAG